MSLVPYEFCAYIDCPELGKSPCPNCVLDEMIYELKQYRSLGTLKDFREALGYAGVEDFRLKQAMVSYRNNNMQQAVERCEEILLADKDNVQARILLAKSIGWTSTLDNSKLDGSLHYAKTALALISEADKRAEVSQQIYWEIKKQISGLLSQARQLNGKYAKHYINFYLMYWKRVLEELPDLDESIKKEESEELMTWMV